MEKLDGKTSDITAGNVEKLRELFPEAFTEGKIDFSALQKALGESIDTESERYSMSWHGKSDAIKMALKQSTATLLPQKAESKDWDTTENLFIEGDNLEVLRVLQDSYRGKVKMIYIDPPYNTGHDFVYTDNFSDNIKNYKEKVCTAMQANADTSGRYHTNWLNMMYPRLRLARNLLRDDGVIFISIDDHEQANLKKICDEIFGEENYLNTFSWVNNLKGRQISGSGAAQTYEYVVVYAKEIENVGLFEMQIEKLKSLMPGSYKGFNYEAESDDGGDYVVKNELYNTNSAFNEQTRPTLVFNIHYNFKTNEVKFSDVNENIDFDDFVKIAPNKNNNGVHKYHAWRWSKGKIVNEINDLKFVKTDVGGKIFTKIRAYTTTSLKDIITDITTTTGSSEIKELFEGTKYFDYPKPVALIKIFISQIDSEGTVLDFFAGSGTTAHAVMDLNAEDGGNRKWICVQIPEGTGDDSEACKAGYKTIADIGKERIRRAGEKIKKDYAEKLAERATPLDTGFKVFALDETNFTQWDSDTKDIQASLLGQLNPLKESRTDLDAVYEVLLKYGIDPTTPIEELSLAGKKVFSLAGGYLLICLEKKITLDTIEEMAKLAPHRAVFYDNGFADDTVKANAEQTLKKAGVKEIMVI